MPKLKASRSRSLSLWPPPPSWPPKMTPVPRTKQNLVDLKRLAGQQSPRYPNLLTQILGALVGQRPAQLYLRLTNLLSLRRLLRDRFQRLVLPCFALEDGPLWIPPALDLSFLHPPLPNHWCFLLRLLQMFLFQRPLLIVTNLLVLPSLLPSLYLLRVKVGQQSPIPTHRLHQPHCVLHFRHHLLHPQGPAGSSGSKGTTLNAGDFMRMPLCRRFMLSWYLLGIIC